MKKLFIILAIATVFYSCSTELTETETQSRPENTTTENLIVITLDGLRWQEVFGDADVFDRDYLSTIGNLYGNRNLGNKVNVANPTNISYPGYHEIFTGNTTGIYGNVHENSPHKSVIEFINEQEGYQGRNVSLVTLNYMPIFLYRASDTVNGGMFPIFSKAGVFENGNVYVPDLETLFDSETIENAEVVYLLQKSLKEQELLRPEIYNYGTSPNTQDAELLSYTVGRNVMELLEPKVMHFYFSMTDLYGHQWKWDDYTNAARNVGVYIKDLINFVDNHPQYANNTTILITTDHGRGSSSWGAHTSNTEGADETWFIVISPYTNKGIVNEQKQYYNEQLAQTMANILGFTYEAEHEIAEAIEL